MKIVSLLGRDFGPPKAGNNFHFSPPYLYRNVVFLEKPKPFETKFVTALRAISEQKRPRFGPSGTFARRDTLFVKIGGITGALEIILG